MNAVLLDSNRAPFDLAIQVTAGASLSRSRNFDGLFGLGDHFG